MYPVSWHDQKDNSSSGTQSKPKVARRNMFKKPFRIKSKSVMKGSDRKKLRAELGKTYPELNAEACNNIIPNKKEVTVMKVHTDGEEDVFIYCNTRIPLLFKIHKQDILYPSVYLLWRYPELVYRFSIQPPVFEKLAKKPAEPVEVLHVEMHIFNLPYRTQQNQLEGLLENLIYHSCRLVYDAQHKKKYAIVDFVSEEEAEQCIRDINGERFGGRELEVRFGNKRSGLECLEPEDDPEISSSDIIVRSEKDAENLKRVENGNTCSVSLVGNRVCVAVGYTLISGSDMIDVGMEGKVIRILHFYGDLLWSFGDKSKPPDLGKELELSRGLRSDMDHNKKAQVDINVEEGAAGGSDVASFVKEFEDLNITENHAAGMEFEDNGTRGDSQEWSSDQSHYHGDQLGTLDQFHQPNTEGLPSASETTTVTADGTDALLEFCFRCAIKKSVKKNDLPLLTSTFYKAHMMKYCRPGQQLSVKSSSFKKLSKFLQKQEKTGIIKIKQSKGVDTIVEIDKSHEDLRNFIVPVAVKDSKSSSGQRFKRPVITEAFEVTDDVMPLFKILGYSKGDLLKGADVRRMVVDYIKANNLQCEDSERELILDDILTEVLHHKSNSMATLTLGEVFSRLLNKMSSVCEIRLDEQPPILKKDVEPVVIDVVEGEFANETTAIQNFHHYCLDPEELMHSVRVRCAGSSTVTLQQSDNGPQVIVQGNQINCIRDLLLSVYKIPRKYIISGVVFARLPSVSEEEDEEIEPRVVSKREALEDNKLQYSLRKCLRISGIPETSDEDTDRLVVDLARDLNVDICRTDISSSCRDGKVCVGRHREIRVTFTTHKARQSLYMIKKDLHKNSRWNGVYINDVLTAHRNKLLYNARQYVRNRLLKSAYSCDGKIYVVDETNKRYLITVPEDLNAFGTLSTS